jgi:hypothetical protein
MALVFNAGQLGAGATLASRWCWILAVLGILSAIDGHFLAICVVSASSEQLVQHAAYSLQHVVAANLARGDSCIQNTNVEIAVAAVLNTSLGITLLGFVLVCLDRGEFLVLCGDDLVVLEVVDLGDEVGAEQLDKAAGDVGEVAQVVLASLQRVAVWAFLLGDWVVGELRHGRGEVDEDPGQLGVDVVEGVDVGGGDLAIRLLLGRGRLVGGRRIGLHGVGGHVVVAAGVLVSEGILAIWWSNARSATCFLARRGQPQGRSASLTSALAQQQFDRPDAPGPADIARAASTPPRTPPAAVRVWAAHRIASEPSSLPSLGSIAPPTEAQRHTKKSSPLTSNVWPSWAGAR